MMYQDAYDYQQKLMEALACKVPTCWFGFGTKAPKKQALYVGSFGDCYCWIGCDQVDALSRFSLTLLELATTDPSVDTVEVRRLFKTPKGEIEVKGTVTGSVKDYATTEAIEILRIEDGFEIDQEIDTFPQEEQNDLRNPRVNFNNMRRDRNKKPGEFKSLPPQRAKPLQFNSIQSLINTP